MDQKPFSLSLELPESLARSLLAYQQQQGIGSTASAIIEILEQFFVAERNNPRYATQEQLQRLDAKVERLATSIALLPQFPPQDSTTESDCASSFPQPQISTPFTFLSDEDELEEEPDEILYDFLDD